MRPNSRGPPGSSGGNSSGPPPGTGLRPGSGRKPPGTGRLRTGAAPTGPGTMAIQGITYTQDINVQDRPVTGQGIMGMKGPSSQGRLVEDVPYYIGILRKKITDIATETKRLRQLVDSNSKDSTSYTQLEKRYETLIKNKETLEGQLADYNLAMDKTRTSTDTEDVKDAGLHMGEKNRQSGQELDRVFMMRKQRESETARADEQIEACYREIQARINELEPGKLRAYNDLLAKQREFQERVQIGETRLNEANVRIQHYEADDKSNVHRKEFSNLEKTFQSLRRETESLQEELDIASCDPKEANTKFVARVNGFKQSTKLMEDKAISVREEMSRLRKQLEDLEVAAAEEDTGDDKKFDLLVKRDKDMTLFMDKFDESRDAALSEQVATQDLIVALLESISRDLDESANMPSQEELAGMVDAKSFKEKNLATAQRTMASLTAEKKKRDRELELLRSSEPKLQGELSHLRAEMTRMRTEMQQFKDVEGLRRAFDATQLKLQGMKHSYTKRRDAMRHQVQTLSIEHENLKKALGGNEVAKEIEETEKRLKHYERSIFELREFVETKSRETDFEGVKENCLKMLETLNNVVIKKTQGRTGGQTGAQAKW